ncbi:MAG: TonB-dependent siderophore receptor [Moritella sp.]|uniref:TonB-dependent siderophore receptor n=2 Tax=unclassified Moritella TaxID=2637987 RepID=UPI000156828F|nr:TonB-dependent siderophore receptor [Moritella sp. PE36]EDM68642.1 putative putative ferrichrome-iron receptor [Moritella sp. PE36]PHR87196.1 MAG: TonB-dependent siderophore receptor [Moritella sp.]
MFCKTRLAVVIATVLAAPGAYSTETVETDEHMEVVGRDYGFKVDTNSTAMRVEATQLETPGQVTVIDEQLIDEQRASTLGNVLKNDSSISAGGVSRNRESFKLRGFDLQSSSGFLRDGKQHWSHYRQPIELLERVEILKGPAGLLYGKSAPGGLINMVAKKPTYETQINISQDLGSNNDSRTTADISGSLNNDQTLRARAIVSKQSYDSWRTYSDGSTPSTERFVGGLFVDYDINDKVTVSVHYDKTNDNGSVDSGAYIVDGKPVGGDQFIWDADWSTIENNVENIGFDIAAQLSDNWNLKLGYNNQDFKRRDIESFTNPIPNAVGDITYSGYDRFDHWEFNTAFIDFVGEFDALGMQHQTLIGANWLGYYYLGQTHKIGGQTAKPGDPLEKPDGLHYSNGSVKDPTERDSYGIYVQDMITVNEQWQVLAGLRFDREVNKDNTHNNVLPKLGLIYHPKENGSIYATYSESFEPKDPINNLDDINNGTELDPVKGKLYEIGSKWELMDNQLFVSGAIFDITQENIVISQDTDNNPGNSDETETTQAGKQVHRGVEFSAMGYVTEAFSLSGSMTYLDATIHDEFKPDRDGNRPADVPEFSASIWTRYSFANNTDVNLGAIYVGERFGDVENTYKKDAYTRFDTGVAYTINYDKDMDLVLRFNIENLFDTDYLAGGSQKKTIVGEGRNYMASIQLRY